MHILVKCIVISAIEFVMGSNVFSIFLITVMFTYKLTNLGSW